ncbi:MAG: type II secretion system protein [Deinococcota bacterium]
MTVKEQKSFMRRQDAFTLVELLVAMAIFSTILVLVMSALRTGSNALTTIVGEADIIEDARAASAIIADEINQAAYIYPPGSVLTLGTAGYTTVNPNTGNRTWTVGDDPILAMITVPDTNEGDCDDNTEFCYTFVAYYPVARGEVSDEVPYLADPANDNGANEKWVLYEFRANLDVGASSEDFYETYFIDGEPIPTNFGNIAGQILVDYVIPDSLEVNIGEDDCYPGETSQNDEYFVGGQPCESVNDRSDIYASVAVGEFVFRSGRSRRGRNYRSPEIRFSLAPLNLHNPLTDRQIYAN